MFGNLFVYIIRTVHQSAAIPHRLGVSPSLHQPEGWCPRLWIVGAS